MFCQLVVMYLSVSFPTGFDSDQLVLAHVKSVYSPVGSLIC